MTLTLISCELEDDATNKSYQSIQLSIYAAENISSHSVTFHATATGKENQSANCGFVWGIRSKPTIDKDSSIVEINKPGSFSSTIRNLSPETTYYLRAFASNKIETVYSDEVSFTTLNEEAEISFEMIEVVGGTFQMGSNDGFSDEKPVHTVTLSSYYIGKYPVTQKLWQAVMGSDPPELHFKGCNDCPVERISWNDIQQFITKLNQQTDKKYRLPTEAEWEYAASGGNQNKGYIYSGSNIINDVAWYRDNSSNKTHTVGEKQPNELGIYDMSGNVWEWCSDWYGSNYYSSSPQTNPTGPSSGSYRVLRGGSWNINASYCRVAYRSSNTPDTRLSRIGFRLALSSNTQPAASLPTITTTSITNITTSTASSGGNVSSDGGASITARGVCWSTNQNPTINNSKTTNGTGIGSFVSSLTGLTANTTYYVRAYATNSAGTAYGTQVSFKTLSTTQTGVNIEMIAVEGGTFQMGSNDGNDEKPIHSVTLSSYSIAKYPVTQAQWQAVMGTNPSSFSGCDNCPVEQVSWNDVQEFIAELNRQSGKSYRLPTEAEWEYAARGGSKSNGYTYSGSNTIGNVAWYIYNSSDKTHPVGGKQANELGIYDMSGNVWEWCSDWYASNYYSSSPQTNPTGPSSGSYRVLRGGSWNDIATYCRVASRYSNTPVFRFNDDVGFRLALSKD